MWVARGRRRLCDFPVRTDETLLLAVDYRQAGAEPVAYTGADLLPPEFLTPTGSVIIDGLRATVEEGRTWLAMDITWYDEYSCLNGVLQHESSPLALAFAPDDAIAGAGITRPTGNAVLLLVQLDIADHEDEALARMNAVLEACDVTVDPQVALAGDDRGAARLFELREAVPAGVNAEVAGAKDRVHPDIEKVAGDFVVPFERQEESLVLYRDTFERYELEYAVWGHMSDGNMHPNVVPRSLSDVERGQAAILEIARGVVAMGGAPLAEHGVGRSAIKQQLLRELYGEQGINEMRAVKRALDPEWKLAAGVLFPTAP